MDSSLKKPTPVGEKPLVVALACALVVSCVCFIVVLGISILEPKHLEAELVVSRNETPVSRMLLERLLQHFEPEGKARGVWNSDWFNMCLVIFSFVLTFYMSFKFQQHVETRSPPLPASESSSSSLLHSSSTICKK